MALRFVMLCSKPCVSEMITRRTGRTGCVPAPLAGSWSKATTHVGRGRPSAAVLTWTPTPPCMGAVNASMLGSFALFFLRE